MNLDQDIETAISLLDELINTQTYLLSGSCPDDVELALVANQSISLQSLRSHLQESLDIYNSSHDNAEHNAIKDLDKSIFSVNESIKKYSTLSKENVLPELDWIFESKLESLNIARDNLMDKRTVIF